jgi:hypothetical protein
VTAGETYSISADVENASEAMQDVIIDANWIVQTYQYSDSDTSDNREGLTVAIDEVF